MNARERSIRFIKGESVDRIPFHPLIMGYAIKNAGVSFAEYCKNYQTQAEVMIRFAREFGMECTHPSGFAYGEASAYGMEINYPEDNYPYPQRRLINDIEEDIGKIAILDPTEHPAMMNRVAGVEYYVKHAAEDFLICGHCEGPLAEYTDLRGVEEGLTDMFDEPDLVKSAMQTITENAKRWAKLQLEAGADCMSIGDAICSQIGLEMYREFVLPFHKELVEYVHSLGKLCKLHICGNIRHLLPDLIKIGVNIIDIDSSVTDFERYIGDLKQDQVFCGNIDPCRIIQQGTPEEIDVAVRELVDKGQGKCMISGGCEIPSNTPLKNYQAFYHAAVKYGSLE